MTTPGSDDCGHSDEAVLAPYFAAARGDGAPPSRDLLSAILADAGSVSADRAAAAASPPAAPLRRPWRRPRVALGGWRVATTLAAASVFGLWVGLSGTVDLGSGIGWTTTAIETDADPVAGFFDLATAE